MGDMIPCYIYVDGGYVRRQLTDWKLPPEFDPTRPATLVQNQRINGRQCGIGRVLYYDAPDPDLPPAERQRQEDYFDAIRRLPDTHVVLGQLRPGAKKREQKGVDVSLAVDALKAAYSRVCNAIVLISGDGDFVPLVRAVRDTGVSVFVFGFSKSLSPELVREADRVHAWEAPPSDWSISF